MTTSLPKVLYAEDDENDVFFMKRAFARLSRKEDLRVVSNGQEAVAYLSGTIGFEDRTQFPLPTILLLDLKMPKMSGIEVLVWVRAQLKFSTLPVILFTSSTQDNDIRFSRDHGANGYFVKPSNADNLSELIGEILRACEIHPLTILPIEGNRLLG